MRLPDGQSSGRLARRAAFAAVLTATTLTTAGLAPASAAGYGPASIDTRVHDAFHGDITNGSVPVFTPFHARIVVAGDQPTGQVDVKLFRSRDCTGEVHGSYPGLRLTNGAVDTPAYTARSTGYRSYRAWYAGDARNSAATGPCAPVNVVKRVPTVRTEVHDQEHRDFTGGTRPLGTTVHDKAFVTGYAQYVPTGAVTFRRWSNRTCSGTPAWEQRELSLSGGTVETSTFKPSRPGWYSYRAKYEGSNQYQWAWGPCEPFRIDQPPAGFIVIDEDSIDNGLPPMFFDAWDVNDDIADEGQRKQLRYFEANVGREIVLWTGEVGDEGWFAVKTIPTTWAAAGPTSDGLRNFVGLPSRWPATNVGRGLGTGDDPERYLDKIPDVTPLRATGLRMLVGKTLCAVVWDSDISINYGPLNGSLKGANLGTVAFTVREVRPLFGQSSGSLPEVRLRIEDAHRVCEAPLTLFRDAPEPYSSSEPYDTGR